MKLELLQKYILIPLDFFKKIRQNKPIRNEMEAWMTFLCSDDPQQIIELIEQYPDFRDMYAQVYELCRNIEGVMDMFFSEELREMDRNTVRYMIEEQEKELSEKTAQLDQTTAQLDQLTALLKEKEAEIALLKQQLRSQSL